MQWILQPFEDTQKLADALDRLGIPFSWHKVVPFVGDLIPEPEIPDPASVVLFGSYGMWRWAEARHMKPGVFRLRPFVDEVPWQPFMLNGPDAVFLTISQFDSQLTDADTLWFSRPAADSKEQPGAVRSARELRETARKVMSLRPDEIPRGSLRPDTLMMLTRPAHILKEWRIWVVGDQVVTYSLYKEGARVTYRPEIDDDALGFARMLVARNPAYSPAYVMDICRTDDGLRLLETNCINAAGFYAADVVRLASAIDALA